MICKFTNDRRFRDALTSRKLTDMKERPKLELKLSKTDQMIEIIGWVLVISVWVMTLVNYQSLPEVIPTHYNGSGVADGFGDKWMILTLPLVSTILFIGLSVLNKFPHVFNYPTPITPENAFTQYKNATRLIRILKVIVVIIFGHIAFQTIRHANGQTEGLGTWFLPFVLGLIFIPLAYFAIKSLNSTTT